VSGPHAPFNPSEQSGLRESSTSTSFSTAWRTVRKHWAMAVGTFLSLTLLVTFYTLGQTKIYRATATLQFDPNPPRPLGKDFDAVVDIGSGNYWDNHEYYQTQYKIIASMRVAQAVVQELDLNHDWAFLKNVPSGSPALASSFSPEEAAAILQTRLSVVPIKDSRLAVVQLDDADPQRAQRILSTLIDTYIEQNLEAAITSTNSAVEWLRSQLDKLKGDLETSEMALHDYKLHKNILSVAFDDQSNMLREQMKQISDALTSVRTKRAELDARRSELAKVTPADPSDMPAAELLASSLLQQFRQRYEEGQGDYRSALGEGRGEQHPDVLASKARAEVARSSLFAEVRNIQGAVERELTAVTSQEATLARMLDQAKKQALDLNLLEIEYNRLRRTKENTEKLYSLVLERTKESDLTRMLRVNNIHVVDRPRRPGSPVRPMVALNIGMGALIGLVLGIAAAMGRAFLDRTIKTPEDVGRELAVPFLGLLPEIDEVGTSTAYAGRRRPRPRGALQNRELIVHQLPSSGTAEASRAIRTNLLFMSPDHPYRALAITSAGPSEGKTTVACCIAIAMAQTGQRVCLVDCDLRRPRIHRIFGAPPHTGLTSAILSNPDTTELQAIETNIPNLSVICAGPTPPNPAELFHSQRFATLLGSLKNKFDRVILDTPPIVAVTDATVLSRFVDGTVIVVRAFATTKDLARAGARALHDVGATVAGVVLNAVNLHRHEYKYYHYYYHQRAYYAEAPSAAQKASSRIESPPDLPS
jgi:polysaccharide biosynthesis transport protein